MRIGSQLARAEFTLLSRSGTACRTADGEYLFRAEFLFHHKLPLPEERFADQRLETSWEAPYRTQESTLSW
jgi:hypothetical protein